MASPSITDITNNGVNVKINGTNLDGPNLMFEWPDGTMVMITPSSVNATQIVIPITELDSEVIDGTKQIRVTTDNGTDAEILPLHQPPQITSIVNDGMEIIITGVNLYCVPYTPPETSPPLVDTLLNTVREPPSTNPTYPYFIAGTNQSSVGAGNFGFYHIQNNIGSNIIVINNSYDVTEMLTPVPYVGPSGFGGVGQPPYEYLSAVPPHPITNNTFTNYLHVAPMGTIDFTNPIPPDGYRTRSAAYYERINVNIPTVFGAETFFEIGGTNNPLMLPYIKISYWVISNANPGRDEGALEYSFQDPSGVPPAIGLNHPSDNDNISGQALSRWSLFGVPGVNASVHANANFSWTHFEWTAAIPMMATRCYIRFTWRNSNSVTAPPPNVTGDPPIGMGIAGIKLTFAANPSPLP